MYRVADYFILLVPQTYLDYVYAHEPYRKTDSVLEALNVQVSYPLNSVAYTFRDAMSKELTVQEVSVKFLDAFRYLFGFSNKENMLTDDWYFLIIGHGDRKSQYYNGLVAGLAQEHFTQFLNFLNQKVKTRLLLYFTCYGGGEHLFYPFEFSLNDIGFYRGLTFNYTTISATHAYGSTYIEGRLFSHKPAEFSETASKRFDARGFFLSISKFLNHKDPMIGFLSGRDHSSEHLRQINFFLRHYLPSMFTDDRAATRFLSQIPMVRFPRQAWFNLVNPGNKVFYLTKTLLDVHQAESKSITVQSHKTMIQLPYDRYVGERSTFNKQQILEIIPEVTISSKSFQAFISLIPYDAMYAFSRINAPHCSLPQVLKAFLVCMLQFYARTFYIGSLSIGSIDNVYKLVDDKKELLFSGKSPHIINDVWIKVNDKASNTVSFQYQGKKYSYIMSANTPNDKQKLFEQELEKFIFTESSTVEYDKYIFKQTNFLEKVAHTVKGKGTSSTKK